MFAYEAGEASGFVMDLDMACEFLGTKFKKSIF